MKGISTTLRTTVLIIVLISCLGAGWAVNENGAQSSSLAMSLMWPRRDSDNKSNHPRCDRDDVDES